MTKSVLHLLYIFAVTVLAGLVWCGSSNAQTADTAPSRAQLALQKPEGLGVDPFEFVRRTAENSDNGLPGQKQARQTGTLAMSARQTQRNDGETMLQYHKTFAARPGEAQKLYNTLVQKYGPPQSVRGNSHIWNIENSNTSHRQSDTVTVILSIRDEGAYELIMDRDRGEDGRATWALPRRKMESPVPAREARNSSKKANARTLLVNPD